MSIQFGKIVMLGNGYVRQKLIFQVHFVSGSRRSCNNETEIGHLEDGFDSIGQIRSVAKRSIRSTFKDPRRSQSCRIQIRSKNGSFRSKNSRNKGSIRSDNQAGNSSIRKGFQSSDGGREQSANERLKRTDALSQVKYIDIKSSFATKFLEYCCLPSEVWKIVRWYIWKMSLNDTVEFTIAYLA
jgi:hypothetical protein